jgi:Vacuolar sorting 38 and autophagy-related subunit 14
MSLPTNKTPIDCPGCHATETATRSGGPDDSGVGGAVLCSACVRVSLRAAAERHDAATADWRTARQECADYFEAAQQKQLEIGPSVIAELQDQSQFLRTQLDMLKSQCGETAVQVYSAQLNLQERQERLRQQAAVIVANRDTIHRLHRSMCASADTTDDNPHNTSVAEKEGALVAAIKSARTTTRTLRFQWALQGFRMHRLQVEEGTTHDALRSHRLRSNSSSGTAASASTTTTTTPFVSGIGKIGGLPLPHAGPELFGVLPAEELQSALRLVAQLTHLVARCLGIWLPHPILLRPPPPPPPPSKSSDNVSLHLQEGDIANMAKMGNGGSGSSESVNRRGATLASSITAALQEQATSFLGEPSTVSYMPTIAGFSMDPSKVQQRVKHAVSAVIAEDQSKNCATFYSLSAHALNQDEFAIALQLLQNNVIALCIRAGVPVSKLWPGEAVLLNLHALYQYCESQAQ